MSRVSPEKIIQVLSNQVVLFLDELITQFPREPDLVLMRIYIKNHYPPKDLMERLLFYVIPQKKKIKDRDETYFLEEKGLFSGVETYFGEGYMGRLLHFKELWNSPKLEDSDRDVIWKWFDSFVLLGERYLKEMESDA